MSEQLLVRAGPAAALRAPARDLAAVADAHRAAGRTVVAVQGLGFVGTAVAAAIACARDAADRPHHGVIGVELPTRDGAAKAARLNAGELPVSTPDPELAAALRRAVCDDANLCATTRPEAFALADVIVVDVPLDAHADPTPAGGTAARVDLRGFEAALRSVGRHMRPDALVIIETTVPVGACEHVAAPLLREERARRGLDAPLLLAHAYERVTPGAHHLRSVRQFWRVYAALDDAAADRARAFLTSFIDTTAFPLRRLATPAASELAKLLENSYRAVTIALMYEWTLLAEAAGVDLYAVVDAIRMRQGTHDNMRTPGFGVGGYCLPKDALLAQWSAERLYGVDGDLELSLHALRLNERMPLHAATLVRELAGGAVDGLRVLVCGVAYLPEVADTRHTPAAVLVDALLAGGARVTAHDPHVPAWAERPDVPRARTLAAGLAGADAVVIGTRHAAYAALARGALLAPGGPGYVVDACDAISDAGAAALHAAGCRVLGVGKGHWRARGYQCPA